MDPTEVRIFLSETLAGRYRPQSFIGAGAFSGAFLADDLRGGPQVAAKILKIMHCRRADAVEEFRGEIELLRKLAGCDRVVELLEGGQHSVSLDHGPSGGAIAVETEFAILELAVCSLADLILHGPSFGWIDRLTLYRDVVKGLHQMHLRGIVHRDVKAENGLVFERPTLAKLADLGRAHDTREPPSFAFEAYLAGRGDPRFAPVEFLWLQGTQDPEEQALADLYLLGSLLFEVGTGVGLTSMVVSRPQDIIQHSAAQPEEVRRRDWHGRQAWLREAGRAPLQTLRSELPPPIRGRAVDLVAMLTDPDPRRRLPSFSGGRRRTDPWDLQWLLARIDGLRRAIDPRLRKAYINSRPRPTRSRHGAKKR